MANYLFDVPRLIDICRQNDVSMVGGFGSVARGDAKKKSDIDLIVCSSKRKSLLALVRLEAGRTLPEPEEFIRQGREDRDVQLFMALGDDLLRPIASKHGLNWEEMNEEERERFIRKIVHE